jgi:glycerate kinase
MMMTRPLRLLVASDKFKGTLTGRAACEAIAAGFSDALGSTALEVRLLPVADGGEGLVASLCADTVETDAADPLGRAIRAGYGLMDGGKTAVIEMAEASGLWRLRPDERDAWRATTRGTGELIRHAVEGGAGKILLGIGGSATNDGGSGMAEALGVRFLDARGIPVTNLPADLEKVTRIDLAQALHLPPVIVACDVTNPLLGAEGCTRIYGPQKGIAAADFDRHERRLSHLVDLAGEQGNEAAKVPGAGAAGGLGFGCLIFLGAELRPGFDLVAEAIGLREAVDWADLIVTGEGRLDGQTLMGKAPAGVAALAGESGKPVCALAGVIDSNAVESLAKTFAFFAAIDAGSLPGEEAMRQAAYLLRNTAARHARTMAACAGGGFAL